LQRRGSPRTIPSSTKTIPGIILSKNSLILLDRTTNKPEDVGLVVSWSDMSVPPDIISLPLKTEELAESLKVEYLNWIHKLGKTKVEGQSLIAYLRIFNNLSFWWLTSVAEKSPFLCESIFKIFKLRTLERIYSENHCQSLIYQGNNKTLHSILKSWCLELGHPYKWKPLPSNTSISSTDSFFKILFKKLPYVLQGFAWIIKKWFERWKHVTPVQISAEKPDHTPRPTIVTFFPNVYMDELEKGDFRSKYWEKLHDYFYTEKTPVDWVWFYFGSQNPSFKETIKLKDKCNSKTDNKQRYFLLEEFLSGNGLWKSLILYLKLRRKAHGINHLHKEFRFSNSKINFFPLMENDWNHSFFGIDAIEKITWAIMFDAMAQKLPASHCKLYTWENQTWERALISAWKRHQSVGKIIGYEHSSIRLMDLRLFSDPETYKEKGVEEFPIPDVLGINSSTGLQWMQDSKYPSEKLTRIEALRYFHLKGKYECFKKPITTSGRTLLIVTGILPEEARVQIQLLKLAYKNGGLNKYDEVWIKPHPGLTLDPILDDLKPEFKFSLVNQPIIELMEQADVIFCANSTGASLEAAWLGIPLIILGAVDSMNLNPLLGISNRSFVKNSSDLLLALDNPTIIDMPRDYFFLDKNFSSWKEILRI